MDYLLGLGHRRIGHLAANIRKDTFQVCDAGVVLHLLSKLIQFAPLVSLMRREQVRLEPLNLLRTPHCRLRIGAIDHPLTPHSGI